MQFSNIFKELCSEKGITQKRALEEIGLARNANQKWKQGRPNGDTLKRIAAYFGVTVDSLLRDESTSSNRTGNVSHSSVAQGHSVISHGGGSHNLSLSNGVDNGSEDMTAQEKEILRIYRSLDLRSQNTVMTYLYNLEDQSKEQEG